jgi:hypothetical protein
MPWNEHFLLRNNENPSKFISRNFSYRNSIPNLSKVTGFRCFSSLSKSSECMTHTGRVTGFQISHQFGRLRVYTDMICFPFEFQNQILYAHIGLYLKKDADLGVVNQTLSCGPSLVGCQTKYGLPRGYSKMRANLWI